MSMGTERWERTKRVLEEALGLAPEQRRAYLDSACGQDRELRAEVESLIASHEEAGSQFMGAAAPALLDLPSDFSAAASGAGPQTDLTGTTLGRLRVVGRLGAGGMGEVWRAEDPKLQRTVAVKRVSVRGTGDRDEAARLLREGQRLSALNHPNIASVYDVLEQDDEIFLVMEYVEGQTLRQRLSHPINLNQFFDIALQCADALTAAHERGILHSDVKPENVMLTESGQVKLLDFGVARRLAGRGGTSTAATQTISAAAPVGGTPSYMAPEVLLGSLPDFRADIFSFGVVLYEMLGGRHPFLGATSTVTAMQILQQEATPLDKLGRAVPAPLAQIVAKALHKKPDERYQTPRELAADLRAVRLGSRPAISTTHSFLGKQNWKVSLFGGIAATLVLLGIFVVRHREQIFHSAGSAAVPAVKTRPSVAVLGFKNLTERPDKAWLSTALAEMLRAELASNGRLRLVSGEQIARASRDVPWSLTDTPRESLPRLRANLDTDYVATGSYAVVGEGEKSQIRLDFRLEDTTAGDTVAEEAAAGSETELFDLVSQIGAKMREHLGAGPVTSQQGTQARASMPSDPKAARLYAEGLNKLRAFETLAARDLLSQAVAADPKSPQPHAALSAAWLELGYDPKAKDEAKKAFELSTNLSNEERLWMEAQYRDLNNEGAKAIQILGTLVDLYPDNLDYGLRLGALENSAGDPKQALATLEALRKLPPPAGDDPRIDLAEAPPIEALGDYKREQQLAAAAAQKGETRGIRLVEARALMYENTALQKLGQSDQGSAALAKAKVLFAATGDLKDSGMTLVWSADFLKANGDLPGARKQAEEALVIFRQIGNQVYAGQALNEIGIVLASQGKLMEAKGYYEQALHAYREADYKEVIGDELGNIGAVLERLGDFAGAKKDFAEAIQIFNEVGDKNAAGITEIYLGDGLAEDGDLREATKHYGRAVELENATGHKSAQAAALFGLADVLIPQDDLQQASEKCEQALALRRELKRALGLSGSLIQAAEIALEEGKAADSEKLAGDALHQLDATSPPARGAEANSILALALLAENKQSEARGAAEQALTFAAKAADRDPKYEAALAATRVDLAEGKYAEARKQLAPVLAQPSKAVSVPYLLEARLALGEIELKSGKTATARAQLASLEKQAREKNFLLIARKATALLTPQSH
ncbi:MAG: protein kinase domain-containing protein [Candidatus Sulfotelmatobacter sp.]